MDNYSNNQYNTPQQQNYTHPMPPVYDNTSQVMSIGQYIAMFILTSIPIVNVICWIVWLCSPNTNKNKKNYVKANIIMWLIGVILSIIVYSVVISLGLTAGALI